MVQKNPHQPPQSSKADEANDRDQDHPCHDESLNTVMAAFEAGHGVVMVERISVSHFHFP